MNWHQLYRFTVNSFFADVWKSKWFINWIAFVRIFSMTNKDIVLENNFRKRNGHAKSLVNVKFWLLMEVLNWMISEEWELRSCQSVEIKCSKCCTILTLPMTHRCLFTKIDHQAGLTHWTTKFSTIVWFHLAQLRAIQVCIYLVLNILP